MKPYLKHSRNILYIILLTIAFASLALIINLVLIFSIEAVFYNKSGVPKYDWDTVVSMAVSTIFIFFIYIKRIKKNKSVGNTDNVLIWSTSFLMVGIIFLYCFGNISYKSLRKYINRDKNEAGISELGRKIIDSALLVENEKIKSDSVKLQWQNIVSEQGNFSIHFPNFKVKEDNTTQLIDGEKVPIHSLSLNTQDKIDPNLGYSISFFPLKKNENIDKFFDRERKSLLSKVNGTLEYENIIDSLDYPCRDLYITIDKKDLKATCRLIYNRNKVYELTVITQNGSLFNKSIYHFIDSFHFLN